MVSLTRSLAVEFGPKNIRANAIAPGYVSGDMPASRIILDEPFLTQAWQNAQRLPQWGEPEDIAAATAFLASDEAKFITGVVLPVDGGCTSYSRMPDFQDEEIMAHFLKAQEKYALS
jgi:NAD(P)-dependent dehydrogenase (short-subunit alcohol dehydrogenase family)